MSIANKMKIRIYGKSPACLETYNLFSDVILKNRKQFNKTAFEMEMVRNTSLLAGSHIEPVVAINGLITSEARVPSREYVLDLLTEAPIRAAA